MMLATSAHAAGVSLTYNYIWIVVGILTIIGFALSAKKWVVNWLSKLVEQGVETNKKLAKQDKRAKSDRAKLAKIYYELGDNGGKSLKDSVTRVENAVAALDKRLDTVENHVRKGSDGESNSPASR